MVSSIIPPLYQDSKTWPIRKVTASIDYITFRLALQSTTNFQAVQSRWKQALQLPKTTSVWAQPIGQDGEPVEFFSNQFDVNLHDIRSGKQLAEMLRSIESAFELAGPLRMIVMEVAVDFLPTSRGDVAKLHQLYLALASRHDPRGMVRWQFLPDRTIQSLDAKVRLDPRSTVYAGYNTHDTQLKGYAKLKDRNEPLPPDAWCVRFETTLQGAGLRRYDLVEVDDIAGFNFRKSLGEHFRFRKVRPGYELTPVEVALGHLHASPDHVGVHALAHVGLKRHRYKRKTSPCTSADSYLVSRAGDALDALTNRTKLWR